MFNRLSALWVVLGAVGGYALGGPAANAEIVQADPRPAFVAPGDEVTLAFERGRVIYDIRCTVAAIQGIWIRCAPDKFATERDRKWYSLQRVLVITEREN